MPQSSSYKSRWLTLSLMLLFGTALSFGATPEAGQKASDFIFSTPDGHPLSLYDATQTGTVVLVVLRGYPCYQCPYCVRQVHDFVESADKFAAAGHMCFSSTRASGCARSTRQGFSGEAESAARQIHLVIDPDYKFTNQYDLRWDSWHETAHPSTFIIDRNNVVVSRKILNGHGDRTTETDILTQL